MPEDARNKKEFEIDLRFLVNSIKEYLNKMKKSLKENNLVGFTMLYKQFNRALGEIIGITKYGNGLPPKEHSKLMMYVYTEIDKLLKELYELEEQYLKRIEKVKELL